MTCFLLTAVVAYAAPAQAAFIQTETTTDNDRLP